MSNHNIFDKFQSGTDQILPKTGSNRIHQKITFSIVDVLPPQCGPSDLWCSPKLHHWPSVILCIHAANGTYCAFNIIVMLTRKLMPH